ncbi:MAG: chemotaxis protein CheX [Planctomycetota bacterium]|nr:chemotaxis protein CheX [Planctomycetota bacterium]
MDNLADQLDQMIHATWQALLGQDIDRVEDSPNWWPRGDRSMLASIQITGGWEGVVTIECTAKLARDMAEAMFGMQSGQAVESEVIDALGELVNVVGGNIKALLDGGAQLTLPAVTTGFDYTVVVPGSSRACNLAFEFAGQHVRVGLLAAASCTRFLPRDETP